MQIALNHNEASVISALIAVYPKPFPAWVLVSQGLPDFQLTKQAAILAVYALQSKRVLRFKRGHLSLTKTGVTAMTDVISATHSIH